MPSAKTVSIADFRENISTYLELVRQGNGRLVVTTHGKKSCAIVSLADLHVLEQYIQGGDMANRTIELIQGSVKDASSKNSKPIPFEGTLTVDKSGATWTWQIEIEGPGSGLMKIAIDGGAVEIEADMGSGKGFLSKTSLDSALILGSGPWHEFDPKKAKAEIADLKRQVYNLETVNKVLHSGAAIISESGTGRAFRAPHFYVHVDEKLTHDAKNAIKAEIESKLKELPMMSVEIDDYRKERPGFIYGFMVWGSNSDEARAKTKSILETISGITRIDAYKPI